MSRIKAALLAATIFVSASGAVLAQPAYDPAQLPEMKGKITQFTLTPRGDIDGFLLADGTEVHVPPSASTALAFTLKPGDSVTIHGLKARALPMIAAASVTNDATGATVTARMGRHQPGPQTEAKGTIKATLHEPRGEVNGVLLDDGTIVRLPPPEAKRLEAQLAVGKPLLVRGESLVSPLGRVILTRQLGADANSLTDVKTPSHPGIMAGMHRHHDQHPQ